MKLNEEYKVNGYKNRWSVIDAFGCYVLLENCVYGDETCYLVVKQNAKVEEKIYIKKGGEKIMIPTIMEIVCETYDDLITSLKEECLI